jgi:hypothetical protein
MACVPLRRQCIPSEHYRTSFIFIIVIHNQGLLFVNKRDTLCHNMTKLPKTGTLRTRCEPQLKARLQNVAAIQQIDLSDVVRIACVRYVEQFSNPAMPQRQNHGSY